MKNSRWPLPLTFFIVLSAQTARPFQILLNSGERRDVRLLSTHTDVTRESIVRERLREAELHASFHGPVAHQIPSNLISPVRNQGSRNLCVYFAATEALETYYRVHMKQDVSLSRECLVDVRRWMADTPHYQGGDRPISDPEEHGDFLGSVVLTLGLRGVPAEANYSSEHIDCRFRASSFGKKLELARYLSLFTENRTPAFGKNAPIELNNNPSLSAIKEKLAKNVPVAAQVYVYREFRDRADWRYNSAIDNSSTVSGGHAVLLTGYETQGKKIIFTFMNSWGTDWGRKGYGTLDSALLTSGWAADALFDEILSIQ